MGSIVSCTFPKSLMFSVVSNPNFAFGVCNPNHCTSPVVETKSLVSVRFCLRLNCYFAEIDDKPQFSQQVSHKCCGVASQKISGGRGQNFIGSSQWWRSGDIGARRGGVRCHAPPLWPCNKMLNSTFSP